jgi:hypothetical protein
MPSTDAALLGMWFALSFGIEQVHGIVALDDLDLLPRPDPPDVHIRKPVHRTATIWRTCRT